VARARVEGDIRCAVSPSMCVCVYVCEGGERERADKGRERIGEGGKEGRAGKGKERKRREERGCGVGGCAYQ
jgi:hypothetical protein